MKMSATISLLFSLFLMIHTSNAFDITQILNKYPEFSTFNSYLTQYNLAAAINARQTITILAIDNGNLSPVSSYPPDVIKNILSVHVILDYYDLNKLHQLASGSSLLTTLFQATGLAKGQQGFLNMTYATGGSVTFSSAMPGSTQGSSLVKLVMADPYNLSILQVSSAIIPQGIDGTKTSSPPSKSPSTPSATPPRAPTTATPPPPAPAMATAPTQSSMAPPPTTATTTAPPQSSMAPPPKTATTTAPPQSSMAPPPKTATTTAPPQSSMAPPPTRSKGMAPSSSPPTSSQAPSAPRGSVTEPGTLAPESPTKDVPDVPAANNKPTSKSAATTVEICLALVCTMALSTLYLESRI